MPEFPHRRHPSPVKVLPPPWIVGDNPTSGQTAYPITGWAAQARSPAGTARLSVRAPEVLGVRIVPRWSGPDAAGNTNVKVLPPG
ncbi:hypothetical protein UO65_6029 [Actinokineospora spheciospongiae]|uniref:Uncharacterized protein n=1 Tax=Actinokineospora spheciospongiae TaxID=909613 RepID=W7ICZ7_9PSEU|nr:hypothetical protein UO65_6029 [Actinokineospora spheciospongiae]